MEEHQGQILGKKTQKNVLKAYYLLVRRKENSCKLKYIHETLRL